MTTQNPQSRKLKELILSPELLCSIWISNHEGVLKERYKLYCDTAFTNQILYIDRTGDYHLPKPDMTFEEYAVFVFDHCAFGIEHNLN
jgi:hypothetical protein